MEVEDIDMEDEGDEDQDMDGEQVVFLAAAFGSLHHWLLRMAAAFGSLRH